jgi:hypothetical protein
MLQSVDAEVADFGPTAHRRIDVASMDTGKRFAPCKCCTFEPANWPWKDSLLRIKECMTQCPYEEDTAFANATKLRRHITRVHNQQNLRIVDERAGRRPAKLVDLFVMGY